MGGHLRFGFETTYGKDAVQMRDDNAADYPWLRYALITLLTELNTSYPNAPAYVKNWESAERKRAGCT